ncbi:MAG: NADH-quinone oxidoreductase subunit NuoF [Gammaproteobacteria bacterium]
MEKPLTGNIRDDGEPLDIKAYEAAGGYQALRRALARLSPADVTRAVNDSNLRGRGGAGFPTGKKWSFVDMSDQARHPKYLIANADEMEPGTFKDRLLMEGNPHQLIEAVVLSAYAIGARYAYIFLRASYFRAARRLRKAVAEAYDKGYLGTDILGSGYHLDLHLHISAGRYICGEETALLTALEGRRSIPRAKPPYPQATGLWGKPTVVNNVETLCNVPHIINKGADWFQGLSLTDDGGTKLYGMSGRLNRPGLWELPMGTTGREVLEEHAGGMRQGYGFRALQPGGASTGFLGAEHLDVPMDFSSMSETGTRMGTGTMIVTDDQICPVSVMRNLEHFFAQESCGWCTPCRDGLPFVEKTLQAIDEGDGRMEDLDRLSLYTRFLGPGNTYCAHAPGAMASLATGLKHFRDELEQHIRDKRCPWRH